MAEPAFDQLNTASDLARALALRRDDLASRARDTGGFELMRAYSDLTDALVRRVYDCALGGAAAPQVAVAAVGGYGRREMSPFSDIDVAFIAGGEEDESADLVVKRAFRLLMDVVEAAGLKVGYSYRRIDDVEDLPLETQTALLDARRVAGSSSLFSVFELALARSIVPSEFVVRHADARQNGERTSDTPFVVEPDIKEGHGGLRDLHTARWIARVALRLPADAAWEGLRARGVLCDEEISDLLGSAEFVARTRNTLHLVAGRCLDTLALGRHEEVALRMGFKGPVEFISAYYGHAHRIWRVYRRVLAACRESELEIESGIVSRDGRLHILDHGLFRREPASILRVFRYAQSYCLTISRDAADLIASVAGSEAGRHGAEAAHTFLDILARPGAAASLRAMAEVGVLRSIVPRFDELMYLIPGDSAHQFTVGEHSIRTVEQLEALLGERSEQFEDILSRVQSLDVLFLAALLHDIGKLDSRKEHARSGAIRAARIAAQLGMGDDSCRRVEFLVRHHLRMAETARLRDLNRPKTIRDFAAVVKDQQLLDMLLLLTVADYRAVGSRHWSQVQTRFLLELHERTYAALRSPEARTPDLDRHRARVRRELSLANLPPDEVEEHCLSMPASYLLNTPPEELAAHVGYVRSARDGHPVVELKDDRAGQFTLLGVVVKDQPGLLSRIAGVLHALRIDIHAAQVFTRRSVDDIAIDTLYIDFEGRQLTEMKKWQLEGELVSVLSGASTVDELLARWRRDGLKGPDCLAVKVLEDLSDHETVIEVRTVDRPGLLYHLTHRISELGLDIHSARVATWGHEARDVFYITNGDGNRLSAEELAGLRKAISDAER